MPYDHVALLNASQRVTEGYDRIEKKITKIRKILEEEVEKKNGWHTRSDRDRRENP